MKYWTGHNKNYFWFESHINDFDFERLINAFPEFIIDHYVLINVFDSGALTWTKEEELREFGYINGIAITNRIVHPIKLPFEQYDEWYIFKEVKNIDSLKVFVNYGKFSLIEKDFIEESKKMDPTWDFKRMRDDLEIEAKLRSEFWAQMYKVQADKFLSQGDRFIFATINEEDIIKIKKHAS